MERFKLKKQNEIDGKRERQVKISNRFAASEKLMMSCISAELEKLLEYKHFSQRESITYTHMLPSQMQLLFAACFGRHQATVLSC
jgi:hypothetical protein